MRHRRLRTAIITIGMLTLLSACGHTDTPSSKPLADPPMSKPQPQTSQPVAQTPSTVPNTTTPDANKPLKIKVYYGNELGDKLIEQDINIAYKQDNEKYREALKALSMNPDATKLPLLKGFTFKTVIAQHDLLTIDVSMAPEARLGAGGEELLLEALKQTIFQFPEINRIELLVDGKAVDSLMGHMELPHPIKR